MAVLWLAATCVAPPAWADGAALAANPSSARLQAEVEANPDNYQAWFRLGVIYSGEGHLHQAIESFRQVISLRPDLAEPHNNLAVIYEEVGDMDAAVRELHIALQKQPGNVNAEENLADLYLKLAIEHYQHVLDQAPDPVLSARYERLLHVRDPLAASVAPRPASPVTQAQARPAAPAKLSKVMVAIPAMASSDRADVMKVFDGWRAAWSARDLNGYFSAYSDGFVPNARTDHAAWKRHKRRIIMGKGFIHIGVKHVVFIALQPGKRAQLTFDEHFESNDYSEHTRKLLEFAKIQGAWRIVREADL